MPVPQRAARFAGCAAALVVPLVGFASPAAAVEPLATGWWSTLGQQAATATALDVPAGGMLVQGGASEAAPTAFAALTYSVPEPVRDATLVIVSTGSTTPGAVLQACRLTSSFTPAEGAAMSEAPGFSCDGAVKATVSGDGATQSFALSDLVEDGELSVAILPTTSTDRVVIAKPTADSLGVVAALPSVNRPAAQPNTVSPAQPQAPAPTSVGGGVGLAPARQLPVVQAPTTAGAAPVAPQIAAPGTTGQQAAVQPDLVASAATSKDTGGGHRTAGMLAGVLSFAAVGMWLAAGRSAARPAPPAADA